MGFWNMRTADSPSGMRGFGSILTKASDRDLAHEGTAVDFRHIIRAYGRAFDRFMIPASALSGQQV